MYADIRKLTSLAYPGQAGPLVERTAVNAFKSAQDDPNFRSKLRDKQPKTLEEALNVALRLEALQLEEEIDRALSAAYMTQQNTEHTAQPASEPQTRKQRELEQENEKLRTIISQQKTKDAELENERLKQILNYSSTQYVTPQVNMPVIPRTPYFTPQTSPQAQHQYGQYQFPVEYYETPVQQVPHAIPQGYQQTQQQLTQPTPQFVRGQEQIQQQLIHLTPQSVRGQEQEQEQTQYRKPWKKEYPKIGGGRQCGCPPTTKLCTRTGSTEL